MSAPGSPRAQRNVESRSFALIQTSFVGCSRSRIVGILMRREIIDRWVPIEDFLSTVAVMNIPIDDQHAVRAVVNLGIPSRYRDVVEQTKTHRAIRCRVMTGRSDERDRIASLAVEHLIDCD